MRMANCSMIFIEPRGEKKQYKNDYERTMTNNNNWKIYFKDLHKKT